MHLLIFNHFCKSLHFKQSNLNLLNYLLLDLNLLNIWSYVFYDIIFTSKTHWTYKTILLIYVLAAKPLTQTHTWKPVTQTCTVPVTITHHRQSVTVPPKPPLDMEARLVGPACHHVLDGSCQDVPIVRQTSRKWRAVVECVPGRQAMIIMLTQFSLILQ